MAPNFRDVQPEISTGLTMKFKFTESPTISRALLTALSTSPEVLLRPAMKTLPSCVDCSVKYTTVTLTQLAGM